MWPSNCWSGAGRHQPRAERYGGEAGGVSVSFTVLDHQDSLYFVRGNNPLSLYHFPDQGLCFYASTQEILDKAIEELPFPVKDRELVGLVRSEILKVDARGGAVTIGFLSVMRRPNCKKVTLAGGFRGGRHIAVYSGSHL